MERGDAGRQPHRHGTDRVAGGGRAGKADAASRRPLREEDGRQTARRLSGSGEGGTGIAPRARPPRLGRSAGSPEGDGGEVRADGGLCRYRPAEVGLPPERGQRGPLPGLPGSRHRTPQPCHPGACGERTGRAGSEAVPRKGGKPGTEGCAPAGGQPGKPHGIAQTGTEGAARQAANRRDRQKEASGEKNQNVGQP